MSKSKINLYQDSDMYICHKFKSRKEWLDKRIEGIGGSDSSVFIGFNPYKTNNELWKEKKGVVKAKELSSSAIDHGNDLEPVLRDWFKKSFKDYDVQYKNNVILLSKLREWQLYSPDGLLFHPEMGKGILEIKTTTIQNTTMLNNWKESIPQQYYVQVLHGLLVTGFDYVVIVAELRFAWEPDEIRLKKYIITREEVKGDLEWLEKREDEIWNEYYVGDKEPPTIIHM